MDKSSKEFIPALGFDWLTRFYDPLVHWSTRESTFKTALIEQTSIESSHRILDVGCGTATLPIQIKKRFPQTKVFALDADSKILEIAKRKTLKENVEITFEHGFSNSLPFDDATFDRVVSTLFFHHLDNESKRRTLGEVFRVLKPGGELHIADFGAPQNALQHLFSHYLQLIDSVETTRDNLEGQLPFLIRETGFSDVERKEYFKTIIGTIRLFKARKL